jgi:DNA processing protein
MNTKYYAAFASNENFGNRFVKKLLEITGDIKSAWECNQSTLYKIEGITTKKINSFIELRNKIDVEKEYEKLQAEGISLLTYEDENYPALLKQIPDPPMWLYYQGNSKLFQSKYNIAVVGSRKSSATGRANLTKILSEFKNSDLCIVSGLALGIDTTAHQIAIDNNLGTIAVLGSGLKNIYPVANKKLYREILEHDGLILSEYPINAEPAAYHFPQRNRIVSGLSSCTLVAEAAIKSGALITARLCLEQNRELMCIPGAISNPYTEGIYKLLKEGAGIVTRGEDILQIMNWKLSIRETEKNKGEDNQNLSVEERAVLAILKQDSLTLDEIAIKTSFQTDNLMVILTGLEIADLIIQTEGGTYSAI